MYCTKGWLITHSKSSFPCPLILCLAKPHTLSSFNFRLMQPHCALSIHSCSCCLSFPQVLLGDWTFPSELVLQPCQLPVKKAMEPSQFTLTIDFLPCLTSCMPGTVLQCNAFTQALWNCWGIFCSYIFRANRSYKQCCHSHFWYSIDSFLICHWHYFMYEIKVLSTAIHVFILMYLLMGILKFISMISRSLLLFPYCNQFLMHFPSY